MPQKEWSKELSWGGLSLLTRGHMRRRVGEECGARMCSPRVWRRRRRLLRRSMSACKEERFLAFLARSPHCGGLMSRGGDRAGVQKGGAKSIGAQVVPAGWLSSRPRNSPDARGRGPVPALSKCAPTAHTHWCHLCIQCGVCSVDSNNMWVLQSRMKPFSSWLAESWSTLATAVQFTRCCASSTSSA